MSKYKAWQGFLARSCQYGAPIKFSREHSMYVGALIMFRVLTCMQAVIVIIMYVLN